MAANDPPPGAASGPVGPGASLPRPPMPPDNSGRQLDKCRYTPDCYIKGRCASPADPRGHCEAQKDSDCQHSQERAALGRCVARNGACFPSDDGCSSSLVCWEAGACAAAPNGSGRIAGNDDQCRHSEVCFDDRSLHGVGQPMRRRWQDRLRQLGPLQEVRPLRAHSRRMPSGDHRRLRPVRLVPHGQSLQRDQRPVH
jgi:hypothetical protein